MESIEIKEMLDAGVHFGHLKKKWNPKMLPYIFMEKKGIHIIDLNKTREKMEEAAAAIRSIARSGRKIMFVATKKQVKEIVANAARSVNMPHATERWLGGMMTNFSTIRKSVKKMQSIDKMLSDGSVENITKKERLVLARERDKMERVFGGISMLNRLPSALFIVDVMHEHISVAEAKKLNIPTFGIVDTNSDPTDIDFPIPANDDATKSVALIIEFITKAIQEGLEDRKKDKQQLEAETKKQADEKPAEGATSEPVRKKRVARKRKTIQDSSNPENKEKAVAPKTEKETTDKA
jgi:small subunit ribosomal protein S2